MPSPVATMVIELIQKGELGPNDAAAIGEALKAQAAALLTTLPMLTMEPLQNGDRVVIDRRASPKHIVGCVAEVVGVLTNSARVKPVALFGDKLPQETLNWFGEKGRFTSRAFLHKIGG